MLLSSSRLKAAQDFQIRLGVHACFLNSTTAEMPRAGCAQAERRAGGAERSGGASAPRRAPAGRGGRRGARGGCLSAQLSLCPSAAAQKPVIC